MNAISRSVLFLLLASNTAVMAAEADTVQSFVLDPVNVTAMKYEKTALETPSQVSVYTAEELRKTGASDVANALKYKPGILATQMGPHDQSWITGNSAINLRGIKGGTLVLIDGVPAGFNNVSHLDMMNLDIVARVEIVKGGGAVLYGSEAYGGVINVITKSGYGNRVHVGVGNKGQREAHVTAGNDRFGIAAGRSEMGATENMTPSLGTKTINGTKVPYYVSFGDSKKNHLAATYKINDRLRMNYMYNQKRYTIDYNDGNENRLQHFMYDDREHFAQLQYKDGSGFKATGYYNYRSIRNPDYYVVNPSNLEWEKSEHKRFGVDTEKRWDFGENHAIFGLNVKREIYSDTNQKFKSFGNSSSVLKHRACFGAYALNGYSLYGQYEKKTSDVTNVTFSFREELIRSDAGNYDAFLPQLQAVTKLNGKSSVYANVGRSFRMPTFRQLYYSSGVLLRNPDLKPEYGWNYEVGYKYEGEKDSLTASLFHVDLKDQITTRKVNVDGTSMTQSYNAAKYRNTGLEVDYRRKLDNHFDFNVGGLYNKPENKSSANGQWKNVLGRYQLSAGLNWHNRKADAAFNMNYMGKRVNNSSQKDVNPLLLSNIHAGYEVVKNGRLTVDVNNVFNRRDLSDPDGNYYTWGRTFLVGFDYKF